MSCCGSRNGSAFSSTALTTLKIVVLTPIASIIVTTATAVNPGRRNKLLRLCRMSRITLLPIANCQLPIADCRLQIAKCQLPVAFFKSAIGNWQSAMTSLVPKRDERIHTRCAPRGHVARYERHDRHQQRDDDERWAIRGTHTVKQSCYQTRQGQSSRRSNCNSDQSQHQSLSHHQRENIAPLRAQCDPDAKLVCALGHRIIDH